MRQAAALVTIAALLACSAHAQPTTPLRAEDHLEPEGTILGGGFIDSKYDTALREALGEMFESDIAARMIAMPAFFPEYAVGLRKAGFAKETGYRVFALALTEKLESIEPVTIDNSGRLLAPSFPWKRKLARCETSISDELGSRITEVWRKMLMRTRYSALYTAGTDGARYDFSMDVRGLGPISGKVWLPDRNSSTGALVALANEMYGICAKKKDASMEQLEKNTAELEHRLQ
jgi:hypothetical protein